MSSARKMVRTLLALGLGRWRSGFDLDDEDRLRREIEIYTPGSGRATPQSMASLLLLRLFRQTMEDAAVAMNIFYDTADDCIRVLEYIPSRDRPGEYTYRELCPAPGCFARQVFQELSRRARPKPGNREHIIHYRCRGRWREAIVDVNAPQDVRIYYSDARPIMRMK